METRKIIALTAAMTLANMTPEQSTSRHWKEANNASKPPRKAKTDRAKAKAARTQNRNRK